METSKSKGWSPFARQCFVTATVGVTIVGHGCTVGYPAVLLPQVMAPADPAHTLRLDKDEASWIASAMSITMLVGSFVSPTLMERCGRRAALLAVAVPAVAGWLVAAGATTFAELFASRIILGLSFGMSLPLRSVLIGEYTSPARRGAFLTTVSLAQATGIFTVHLVGSLLSWQVTALACSFFPFLSFAMGLYSPESPSYLAAKGRFDECRQVFRWLRGPGEEQELEDLIQARVELMEEPSGFSFSEILATMRKKEFYKPIFIMNCANTMMQFSGGNTMSTYAPKIIRLIIGENSDANFWMIFLDSTRLVVNVIAIYFLNRYRRRTMLFTIGSICVFSHLAIAGYTFGRHNSWLPYEATWIPVVLLNLHYFTVSAGMVPLPNVIAGEIFPLQYRSIGGCITITFISFTTFLVLKTFPTLISNIGIYGTYVLYAGVISFCLFLMWLTMPETKGRTLQQIEDEFKGKVSTDTERDPELERLQKQEMQRRKMSVVSTISLAVDM